MARLATEMWDEQRGEAMASATAYASAPDTPSGTPAPAPRAYLHHVNMMRGLAILFVIAAHCWPCFDWSPAQKTGVLVVLDNVTILFMFISGLLFQHLSDRFDYRRYLKRRMSRVMLPYAIVSIPGILLVVFVQHREDVWPWVYQMPQWKQALFFLVTGRHLAPLWFMPMMFLYIVAAPLFVMIDRRNLYAWLLPPTIVAATYMGRDYVPGMANVFGKALFMLPVYLAGMAYNRHRVAAERWCARHWPWLAALLVASSAAIATGDFGHPLGWDISLIQKLAAAPLLLLVTNRLSTKGWLADRLQHLARISFGLYFVHGYVITTARILISRAEKPYLHQGAIFPPTFLGLIASILVVTIFSVLIVEAVRKLFGARSRMIIGA